MILPARSQGAGVNGSSFVIETKAGLIQAVVEGQEVAMRMTDPTGLQLALELSAEGRKFQAGFINTGVPHLVVPVEDLQKLDVESLGRSLRRHPHFAPQGTNVNFISDAPDSGKLRVRTYERGVEAETLACGTGITASAILHALWQGAKKYNPRVVSSTPRKIKVLAKSGDILTVSFRVSGSWDKPQLSHVILQGQAKSVFEGFIFWSNK
ncbi:MAG: diaminopimelate epimerase [Candidatus Omnitrophica bacterium]|nr:diaminopimelate epimerase [Candidatus Omnitrophota bacterium]